MKVSEKFDLYIDRVDFSHKKNLYYDVNSESAIDRIIGKAIHISEDGKEHVAGEIVAHQINLAEIINDRSSIESTLDEHSHSLSEFIPFFSRHGDHIFSKKIYKTFNLDLDQILFEDDDVLVLDNLYIEKKFRGKNISQILIECVCNDYRRKGRFAFLKAFPLQFAGTENFENFDDEKKKQFLKEKEEFKDRSFEASQAKLVNLYKKCGFKEIIGEKEFMVQDLFERDW